MKKNTSSLILKKTSQNLQEDNFVFGMRACHFIKKRLQYTCFSVSFAKCLWKPILQNICQRLPLLSVKPKKNTFTKFTLGTWEIDLMIKFISSNIISIMESNCLSRWLPVITISNLNIQDCKNTSNIW